MVTPSPIIAVSQTSLRACPSQGPLSLHENPNGVAPGSFPDAVLGSHPVLKLSLLGSLKVDSVNVLGYLAPADDLPPLFHRFLSVPLILPPFDRKMSDWITVAVMSEATRREG